MNANQWRVVYRAFSGGCPIARCICTQDQWGYWSYRVEILLKAKKVSGIKTGKMTWSFNRE